MFKLTTVRTILAWIGAITVVIVFGAAITQGWSFVAEYLRSIHIAV